MQTRFCTDQVGLHSHLLFHHKRTHLIVCMGNQYIPHNAPTFFSSQQFFTGQTLQKGLSILEQPLHFSVFASHICYIKYHTLIQFTFLLSLPLYCHIFSSFVEYFVAILLSLLWVPVILPYFERSIAM